MRKIVVDASVAIKWFVPEIHSEAAGRLFDPQIVLCAPDLIVSEFGNTLWKKVRRGDIPREEAEEILASFAALPLDLYPTKVIQSAAFQLALELDRSVHDSIYLALAIAQRCTVITADRKFHAALAASPWGDQVQWVEDEVA
jgi:predicted nucleic acid-binding protein